ncbi:aminotransferase [Fredinandcohnia salidurans]|uniref:Aminotransferase n=1 Tax=Fredinandcohnia salidurans TaxID=2595041 RepID=A0ABW4MMI9_9BACI
MTSQYLSKKVQELQPSGIRRFFDLAVTMEGVISLGVGEPDFVTPWSIREASIQSIESGITSYTGNAGLLELRQEISAYLHRSFGVKYTPEHEVIVTVGGSQAIDLALRAVVDPGDEVIIVEPTFVAYSPIVSLAGGVPIPVHTRPENEFKLQPEEIEKVVTERTKAIIICSPNNPTGTMLRKEELEAIAKIVEKHDLLVISDEIYAELSYEGKYTSFSSIPGMFERTILVSGFSKGFAMTGWRLGYSAAPREISEAMLKIHQYTMMCASTMAQYGAIEALRNGLSDVEYMRKSYRQRRNFFVSSLQEIGLSCHMPGGAFYAFPSIKETGLSSEEFAHRLLMEERVAVVPGNVFGESGEGFIRCSYASSLEQLQEAVKRMGRFLKNNNLV